MARCCVPQSAGGHPHRRGETVFRHVLSGAASSPARRASSGHPVKFGNFADVIPSLAQNRAVPPVERIYDAERRDCRAKSASPLLSYTLTSAVPRARILRRPTAKTAIVSAMPGIEKAELGGVPHIQNINGGITAILILTGYALMGSISTVGELSIYNRSKREPWQAIMNTGNTTEPAYACDTFSSPVNFRKLAIAREPMMLPGRPDIPS